MRGSLAVLVVLGSWACVFWPESSQLYTFVPGSQDALPLQDVPGPGCSVVQGAPQALLLFSEPDEGAGSLGLLGQTVVFLLSLGLASESEGPSHGPCGII